MNIAFVNPEHPTPSGKDHGGIATYTFSMASAMAVLGHQVTILMRHGVNPDPLPDSIRIRHFGGPPVRPVMPLQDYFLNPAIRIERGASRALRQSLCRLLETEPVDVVEVPEYNGLAHELGGLGIPVVVHFHTPTKLVDAMNNVAASRMRRQWYRYENNALRKANGLKCTSASLRQLLEQNCGIPSRSIQVIRNPVPTGPFDAVDPSTPPGQRNRIDLLFSGRLERRKGAEVVLETIVPFLSLDDRLHVTIAGETELGESRTYRLAVERRLPPELRNRVWFLGPLDRQSLVAVYRRATVFFMPSLFDNAPNSLFEAMAARLPVIASNVGGIDEIIEDGRNGLLFPVDQPQKAVACLRSLLSSPERRKTLGDQAYHDVRTIYDPLKIARETLAYYQTVQSETNS